MHQAQNYNLLCKLCDECFHDANSKMSAFGVLILMGAIHFLMSQRSACLWHNYTFTVAKQRCNLLH